MLSNVLEVLLSYSQTSAQKLRKQTIANNTKSLSKGLLELYGKLNTVPNPPDHTIVNEISVSPCNPDAINSSDIAIIVETRQHPHLEKVIENIAENTDLVIQVYHGTNNKEFIVNSKISTYIAENRVTLTNLGIDKLSASKYNALFLSLPFWESMISRNKILVFQTDTYLCPNSKYQLSDFTGFDYIGSRWFRYRPVGLIMDGGNGGLSLRDWKASTQAIKTYDTANWPGGEDGFFAFHIDLLTGNVGRKKDCEKFGTQYWFKENSWGVHQPKCLNKKDTKRFLDYCKNSAFLFDR